MAVEDVEREAPYFPVWDSRYERVFAMFITSPIAVCMTRWASWRSFFASELVMSDRLPCIIIGPMPMAIGL